MQVQRLLRIIAAAILLVWIAAASFGSIAAWRFGWQSSYAFIPLIAGYIGMVLLIVVAIPIVIARGRRLRRIARSSQFRPCRSCGHSLAGLPRFAQCPECGTVHDTVKLQQFWKRWLRRWSTVEVTWMVVILIGMTASLQAVVWGLNTIGALAYAKALFPPLIVACGWLAGSIVPKCFRRRLIQSRFKLCRRCGKRLNGDRARGKCPLCTLPYTLRDVQQQWHDDYPVEWNRDVLVTSQRAASSIGPPK